MRFIDLDTNKPVTLQTLRDEFNTLRAEQPDEYNYSFTAYAAETIRATINGRNDMDIIGLTPNEIERIINRIESKGV